MFPDIAEQEPIVDDTTVSDEGEQEDSIPEEWKIALKVIIDAVELEDQDIRVTQLKVWRQLQEYARNIFDIYWDETAHDWRSFSNDINEGEIDEPSRCIGIFRAHMESVIAALSIKIPGTDFFPDDANNPNDIQTAEGMTNCAMLIQKHNQSSMQFIRSLYIMWTQGTVCAYNYYRTDPKFGTVQIPEKEQKEVTTFDIFCSYCGSHLGSVKETRPVEPLHCQYCNHTELPETQEYTETIERVVGYNSEPKGREALDFFGPINVKIPFYARKQEDCGYLRLKLDSHYAMLKSLFKEEDIGEGSPGEDTYERYMRLSSEYRGNIPRELNVVNCLWVRPWMLYAIKDKDVRDQLLDKYKKGIYIISIDDKIVSLTDENFDDHWTISIDPLSDFIHNEPLGKPLAPVQEMRNDLVDLKFKSVEYSIPENFVDRKVLDLDKYKNEQATPGMFTGVKPNAGQSIGDAFFQTSPSHLSPEVNNFADELDSDGQFVVGDFPSVYGGPSEGSKTAFEYDKSNAQALQRLSLTWKRLTVFWNTLMGKAVVEFVEHLKEDERTVKKENGRFLNVWIRKTEMTGKIGSVEPETNEQLPQSWEQKWHLITDLLGMKDPVINQVLLAPENSQLMKQAVAMPQFYIPGDNDRTKQFDEIYDIIEGLPVTVDPDMDDHPIHMRVIKCYMTSSQGIYLYKTNPTAYGQIIQHYKEHEYYQSLIPVQEPSNDVQAQSY